MERIVVFGNSGSGKSSLAKALARLQGLAHLDLDVIAWEPVGWVREYETRDDEFSLREHRRLFDEHDGPKVEYSSNAEAARRAAHAVRLNPAGLAPG